MILPVQNATAAASEHGFVNYNIDCLHKKVNSILIINTFSLTNFGFQLCFTFYLGSFLSNRNSHSTTLSIWLL